MPEAQEKETLAGLTGPKIHLQATRRRIDLANFNEDSVDIRDIAYLLPRIYRFNGNTVRPISVAEHSITVYQMVLAATGDYSKALDALLHDGTEAYIGDIPSPVKAMIPGVKDFEEGVLWPVISKKFGLSRELPEIVHFCDRVSFYVEALCLCDPDPEEPIETWGGYEEYGTRARKWIETHGAMSREVMPHPQVLEQVFLEIFNAIVEARVKTH